MCTYVRASCTDLVTAAATYVNDDDNDGDTTQQAGEQQLRWRRRSEAHTVAPTQPTAACAEGHDKVPSYKNHPRAALKGHACKTHRGVCNCCSCNAQDTRAGSTSNDLGATKTNTTAVSACDGTRGHHIIVSDCVGMRARKLTGGGGNGCRSTGCL